MCSGGLDLTAGNGQPSKAVERYALDKNNWVQLPEMYTARTKHSSCAIDETVYVFCGQDAEGNDLSSIEKLCGACGADPSTAFWIAIELGPEFSPCYAPTVSQVNENELVIIGGQSSFLNAYIQDEALFVLDKESDDGYQADYSVLGTCRFDQSCSMLQPETLLTIMQTLDGERCQNECSLAEFSMDSGATTIHRVFTREECQ